MCLVCGDKMVVMKKGNIEHHYSMKHATLDQLKGRAHSDNVAALRPNLGAQQVAIFKSQVEQVCVMHAGFMTSVYEMNGHDIDAVSIKY